MRDIAPLLKSQGMRRYAIMYTVATALSVLFVVVTFVMLFVNMFNYTYAEMFEEIGSVSGSFGGIGVNVLTCVALWLLACKASPVGAGILHVLRIIEKVFLWIVTVLLGLIFVVLFLAIPTGGMDAETRIVLGVLLLIFIPMMVGVIILGFKMNKHFGLLISDIRARLNGIYERGFQSGLRGYIIFTIVMNCISLGVMLFAIPITAIGFTVLGETQGVGTFAVETILSLAGQGINLTLNIMLLGMVKRYNEYISVENEIVPVNEPVIEAAGLLNGSIAEETDDEPESDIAEEYAGEDAEADITEESAGEEADIAEMTADAEDAECNCADDDVSFENADIGDGSDSEVEKKDGEEAEE